ncbi:hypothetical protein ACFS6H_19910 [Terrimonas rubra]|uniref:Uncharacterized protein n=1 Tax=Terrimonas rubra TaxID=1035890 RepID=A0ABW6AD51_9BACT
MTTLPQILNRVLVLLKDENNKAEKIVGSSCYWLPLSLTYDNLVRSKEITPISELPPETKKHYWGQVKGLDVPRYTKIMIVQALYLFDLINEK